MDIDSVQLEVKNEEGVAPAPVRRGYLVAIIIIENQTAVPKLCHFFESSPEYESPSGFHYQPTACYNNQSERECLYQVLKFHLMNIN